MKKERHINELTKRKFRSATSKTVASKTKYEGKWKHQLFKHYTDEEIEQLADEMLAWFKLPKNFWLKTFAVEHYIGVQRIAEMAKRNQYFGSIYELCQIMQEEKLMRLGLDKNVGTAMAIFALKNVSGWRDRQDITSNDESISAIKLSIVKK